MKRLTLILTLFFALSFVGCTDGNRKTFDALHGAFSARGDGVAGYEVTEITEGDGFDYFIVRVCLNTDDAQTLDDYMWFEAEVMRFDAEEDAVAAYNRNAQTGLGGTCLQDGSVLIFWMEDDPFADLYKEVFTGVIG